MPTLSRALNDASNAAQRLNHQISMAQTGGPDRPAHVHNIETLCLEILGHVAELKTREEAQR